MLKKNKNRVYIYGGDKLKYTKLIKEKEYLIKTAINDLNILIIMMSYIVREKKHYMK